MRDRQRERDMIERKIEIINREIKVEIHKIEALETEVERGKRLEYEIEKRKEREKGG